jgi:HAE1 family hydrophobic/amphiphilic exporter-1
MSLSRISIERPVTVFMFTLGVVLLGVLAFRELSVDFLPSVNLPRITIQTRLPGSAAEAVEGLITSPIEAAIGTAPGVRRLSSVSRQGLSVIVAEFRWGTTMDLAMIDLRERVDQVRRLLPIGAGRPLLVRADPSDEPIMTLVLWAMESQGAHQRNAGGDSMAARLAEVAEACRSSIKYRIEQIEGVAQVVIAGAPEPEIHVNADVAKLRSTGLSLDDVVTSLREANVNLPGGVVRRGGVRIPLRIIGDLGGVEEIRRVAISGRGPGRCVRVADVADVVETYAERAGVVRFNGDEVLALYVRKESGANTVRVSRRVGDVIDRLRVEYPRYRFALIDDQAEYIQQSVDDVRQAIVLGGLLSFLVLFFFLKNSLYPVVAGLTIPVSILATLAAMYFLGITLNVISLTGLAVGVGMLGDNAIIVMENVTRLREQGLNTREAVLAAVREINLAATASTLTNVAVFLPVVWVEGVAGRLFADMGVTMAIALVVSLVVAVTLVPALLASKGRSVPSSSRRLRALAAFVIAPVHRALLRTAESMNRAAVSVLTRYLSWGLDHRRVVFVITSLFFAGVLALAMTIPGESAPAIRQQWYCIDLSVPLEMPPAAAGRFSAILEDRLRRIPEVEAVCAVVGVPEDLLHWQVGSATARRGALEVRVRDGIDVDPVLSQTREFLSEMQRQISGLEFRVRFRGTILEQLLRPGTSDVEIMVGGPDPRTAADIARRFVENAGQVRGLEDPRWGRQEGSTGFALTIGREESWRYGVSVRDAGRSIMVALQGVDATTLSDVDGDIRVKVQLSGDCPATVERLLDRPVPAGQKDVPIRAVARWARSTEVGEIRHENQRRVIVAETNVVGRPIQAVLSDLRRTAARTELPPGYAVTFGGENEEIRQSLNSLVIILALSILAVYMILAAEYESVLLPLVIILTSPLAFVGAIVAMVLTGNHYNIMSMVGLVIMVGAVDNDAVIAVDVIARLQRAGVPLREAVREGLVRRLRAILMTTATTVLGVAPLLAESGSGSDLVRALTIPLVGGLISSTLFTLTVIPLVYASIDRWRQQRFIASGDSRDMPLPSMSQPANLTNFR